MLMTFSAKDIGVPTFGYTTTLHKWRKVSNILWFLNRVFSVIDSLHSFLAVHLKKSKPCKTQISAPL